MRRATNINSSVNTADKISIHALLAESDRRGGVACYLDNIISIHALLAESDSLLDLLTCPPPDFYPRSPCGERLNSMTHTQKFCAYFYPRSPCGERPAELGERLSDYSISIHALLAESDGCDIVSIERCSLFLSTLSLRRATNYFKGLWLRR